MADLDFRFDRYTEEYSSEDLKILREYAQSKSLPDRVRLEVGTNRGRFLTKIARANPEAFFIGLEIRPKYARRAQKRLKKKGIENADVLAADANLALPVLFDEGQISDVFVLFPDPWWKTRQRKRRVIQEDFLDVLAPKMVAGGHIWIRTDVGPLADDMREILDAHPEFEPVMPENYPTEPFPRSTREEQCVEMGLPIHALYYRRST